MTVIIFSKLLTARLCSIIGITPDHRSRVHEFEPHPGHISFMQIDHEIISMTFLLLPLTEERQLSFTGETMCTGSLSLPRNNVSRLTDWLDMTLIVLTGM